MKIECSLEHNLPDSPFASPTKGAGDYMSAFSNVASEANDNDSLATSSNIGLGALDMGSFKSFNCQMPRYSSKSHFCSIHSYHQVLVDFCMYI